MMESSIEKRAFKSSSLVSEAAFNPAHQLPKDYLFVSPASHDFSVDQFFDLAALSDDDEHNTSSSSSSLSLSSQDQIYDYEGASCSADGLAIPADDIRELELWSQLMDDTFHDDMFKCPTRSAAGLNPVRFEIQIKPVMVDAACFPLPVLSRPRSKRPRPTSATWSSSSLLQLHHPLPSPRTGTRSTKNQKSRVRSLKRKEAAMEGGDPVQERKCTHCQVQKTPQWRTGPLGPKSLCNACGVRYKSGRLFPEYRPACSPSFSSEIHSNSHRKVLEMRKTKMSEPTGPVLLLQY